jgi:hypothetical protein
MNISGDMNTMRGKGGAVYNDTLANTHIHNCIFGSNQAALGGAIFNFQTSPYITNCIFFANMANSGSAIHNNGLNPSIIHCTFSMNQSGAGTIYNNDSSPKIVNTILWGNSGSEIFNTDNSSTRVEFSIIDQDGYEGIDSNIRRDPLFDDVDLHLTRFSPARNKAERSINFESLKFDIDNASRYLDNGPDIGADEYVDSDGDGTPDYLEEMPE